MTDKSMPFLEHLEELRRVFFKVLFAIMGGTVLCLAVSPKIYHYLKLPLQQALPADSHFIITTPFESYLTYFKISLLFGFFLASPFIFYFFWSFIKPGLHHQEAKGVVPIALISSLLFVGGALFGYFVVFPAGFHFAVRILQNTDILLYPKMSDYLSLALRLLLAFGLIFELPLFLWILGYLGVVDAPKLRRIRKFVIIGIFLLAGILTPGPDVLSQLLMALPLMLLYEVGIILVQYTANKAAAAARTPGSNN